MKFNIKKLFVALLALFTVVAAQAAPTNESTSPYSGNEFSVSAFSTYQATGARTGQSAWGGGIEADYFVTKHFGLSMSTSKDQIDHGAFFQNLTLAPIVRLPLGNSGFAPYGFGGVGFDFAQNNDRYYFAGAGIEYRFTKHVGVFVDGQYVFRGDIRSVNDGKTEVRSGLRWVF